MSQPQNNPVTRETTKTRELVQEELREVSEHFDFIINRLTGQVNNLTAKSNMDFSINMEKFEPRIENATLWLEMFQSFARSKNLDDQFLATFPLFLNPEARQWYLTLPDAIKSVKDSLIREFKFRFHPEGSDHKLFVEFINRIQNPNESVESYLDSKQYMATKAGMAVQTAVNLSIEGLLPPIKSYVYTKNDANIGSFKDLVTLVRKFRETPTMDLQHHNYIHPTHSAFNHTLTHNCCSQQTSCCPVFTTQTRQGQTHNCQAQNAKPFTHRGNGQYKGKPKMHNQATNWFQQQNTHTTQSHQTQGYKPRFNQSNGAKGTNQCKSCGKNHPRSTCAVFQKGVMCHKCHKPGHLARVCRSA
jgi:hypothetical protein